VVTGTSLDGRYFGPGGGGAGEACDPAAYDFLIRFHVASICVAWKDKITALNN